MSFYDPLRQALSAYPAGVHAARDPATPAALQRAEARLGRTLPADLRDLLRSWNGMTLFQESIVLFGTEELAQTGGPAAPVRVGHVPEGALWMDAAGTLRLVDEAAPDPIVCGSTLPLWAAATLSREALVFDRHGEFRDVFDDEGALLEAVRRKRVRAGRRHDPQAALYLLEEAELLLAGQRPGAAAELLAQAVALDPQAGPAWELLAALHREAGRGPEAEQAALQAAAATRDPWLAASRFLDAAEAVPPESSRQRAHADAARQADPEHGAALLAEARERLAHGERTEAESLCRRLRLLADAGTEAGLAELERALRQRAALQVLG